MADSPKIVETVQDVRLDLLARAEAFREKGRLHEEEKWQFAYGVVAGEFQERAEAYLLDSEEAEKRKQAVADEEHRMAHRLRQMGNE